MRFSHDLASSYTKPSLRVPAHNTLLPPSLPKRWFECQHTPNKHQTSNALTVSVAFSRAATAREVKSEGAATRSPDGHERTYVCWLVGSVRIRVHRWGKQGEHLSPPFDTECTTKTTSLGTSAVCEVSQHNLSPPCAPPSTPIANCPQKSLQQQQATAFEPNQHQKHMNCKPW
jgi:hypothetical protein